MMVMVMMMMMMMMTTTTTTMMMMNNSRFDTRCISSVMKIQSVVKRHCYLTETQGTMTSHYFGQNSKDDDDAISDSDYNDTAELMMMMMIMIMSFGNVKFILIIIML
jgi:hypothetical protein